MNPKLLRMYSDMLGEQAATPPQTGTGASGTFNAVAPAPIKLSKPVGKSTAVKPASTSAGSMAARGKVDAMKGSQASDAQTNMTLGGRTGVTQSGATQTAAAPAAPATPPSAAQSANLDTAKQNLNIGASVPGAGSDTSTAAGALAAMGQRGSATSTAPAAPTTPPAATTTATDSGSSMTNPANAAQGQTGASSSSYTSPAGMSGIDNTKPVQATSGTAVGTGTAGVNLTSTDGKAVTSGAGIKKDAFGTPQFEEELEEELAEAFNDMLRLSGLPLNEKAVSKQQQKFMGMVHAMHKGERVKGASAELKKAAQSMGKKDAKDFASTKHKGLPQKVSEGLNLTLDESGHTLNHIVNRFKHEVKKFLDGDMMSENLYDALYDYYLDRGDMPYGIAKAREGDPYAWTVDRFYDDITADRMDEAPVYEVAADDPLHRLAELAGLTNEGIFDTIKTTIDKATLPKAMHSKYDQLQSLKAEREFQQSGSAYQDNAGAVYDREGNPKTTIGISAKDYLDPNPNRDRDLYAMKTGSKSAAAADKVDLPSLNRLKESELLECGDMGMDMEDRLNVSTNMSSDGTRSVNISAQGDRADELLQMLKMAGMRPHDDHEPAVVMIGSDDEIMDEDRPTEYTNTPKEKYNNIETQFIGGDGEVAGKEKRMHAGGSARFSDNPLAVDEILDEELSALLDSILVHEQKPDYIDYDEIAQRVKATFLPLPKDKIPDQSQLPLQNEPYHGPRTLKTDSEPTGTEKYGKDDEKEIYDEGSIKKGGPNDLTGTWSSDPPEKGQPDVPPPVPMDPVYPNAKNINRPEPQMKNMPLPKNSPEPQTKNMPRPKNAPEPRMKPMQRK